VPPEVPRAFARRADGFRHALAGGLWLAPLVYLERAILFIGTPRQVGRALYGMNPFPEAVEIGKYLKDRTSVEDRIAVVGSEPEIYFYAQRRGATGYVYTYPLMDPHPYAVRMQQEMIREIEAGDPRFVVYVRFWYSWLVRPESDQAIFRWFDEYQKRFERVGVFQFSREEGTASDTLDGQLPARIKAARQKKLLGIQRKISKMHQQSLIGRTLEVLVEGVSEETDLLLEGRWMGQAPEIDGKVYVNRGEAAPGQIVPVLIEQAGDYDLVGGIAGAEGPAVALAPARAQLLGAPVPAETIAARIPRPRFPILSH